ncbi:hypothetical protein [uncultured Roseobacter sp.]|nr:hypothetical protein [uncultured Roseobacter sp.]
MKSFPPAWPICLCAHREDAPIERVATETVRKHAPSIWCAAARLRNDILDAARELVHSSGWLVYATSSVLRCENEDRIAVFLHRNIQWKCTFERRFGVTDTGDGFFTAHLTRV